jgi:hypothetical protein
MEGDSKFPPALTRMNTTERTNQEARWRQLKHDVANFRSCREKLETARPSTLGCPFAVPVSARRSFARRLDSLQPPSPRASPLPSKCVSRWEAPALLPQK